MSLVTFSFGVITTVVGNGTVGSRGDGAPPQALKCSPLGIALDSAGNFYIFQPDGGIRKISNGVIGTVAGNGSNDNSD
jgi:hypothetical protein